MVVVVVAPRYSCPAATLRQYSPPLLPAAPLPPPATAPPHCSPPLLLPTATAPPDYSLPLLPSHTGTIKALMVALYHNFYAILILVISCVGGEREGGGGRFLDRSNHGRASPTVVVVTGHPCPSLNSTLAQIVVIVSHFFTPSLNHYRSLGTISSKFSTRRTVTRR